MCRTHRFFVVFFCFLFFFCFFLFVFFFFFSQTLSYFSISKFVRYHITMVAGLCHFVFSPRNNAWRKNEKTKSATRKDDKLTILNGVFSHGVFSSFRVGISTFRVAGFVISSFRVPLFRLFAWRLFVFSFFRVALFRDEMAQTSHHSICVVFSRGAFRLFA